MTGQRDTFGVINEEHFIPDRTDNGFAALAAAMELHFRPPDAPPGGSYTMETYRGDAAAILGERGVFLPDGLDEQWSTKRMHDAEAEVERLRAALEALIDSADRYELTAREAHVWDAGGPTETVIHGIQQYRAALEGAERLPENVCAICHRVVVKDAHGGLHPSPGDHDPAYHVAAAYGTGTALEGAE